MLLLSQSSCQAHQQLKGVPADKHWWGVLAEDHRLLLLHRILAAGWQAMLQSACRHVHMNWAGVLDMLIQASPVGAVFQQTSQQWSHAAPNRMHHSCANLHILLLSHRAAHDCRHRCPWLAYRTCCCKPQLVTSPAQSSSMASASQQLHLTSGCMQGM